MSKILNSLSAVYLNQIANEDSKYGYDKKGNSLNPVDIEKKKRKDDDLAGAPNKKAKKDYDKDGKLESPEDEYKGSKDKAIKKAMKKEGFSNWRQDLQEIPDYDQIPVTAKKENEKIVEKKVKNTIKINPEMKEDVEIISEKEVDVKDTRRTVDAIRAYDRSKDASRDATYDTDHGKKKKGDKEKAYAKKERGEIDKDDPNWKKKKYHTGMHGESYETQKTKEVMGALKKRDLKDKVKKKIAADIVKKKGDTSKSDDRYAYEDHVWDKVADMLTELGKLNDVSYRVEGYQRNPEEGERKERAAAKKGEAIRGQARRRMPPRGNKDREEFERWYAANVR